MKHYGKRTDLFWGLLFVLGAAVILLDQFVWHRAFGIFTLAASVILAAIFIKSLVRLSFFGIFMPLGFAAVLYAKPLGIEGFTPWPALFTALLLSIGFSIIFKRPRQYMEHKYHKRFVEGRYESNVVNEQDSNVVSCSVNFGETVKYVNSDNFEKAHVKCSFGSAKVYFDHAVIQNGSAEIVVDANFGEIQLFIPRGWRIKHDVNVFLGDFKEVNPNDNSDTPVVTVRGGVNFGDIKIIYI